MIHCETLGSVRSFSSLSSGYVDSELRLTSSNITALSSFQMTVSITSVVTEHAPMKSIRTGACSGTTCPEGRIDMFSLRKKNPLNEANCK